MLLPMVLGRHLVSMASCPSGPRGAPRSERAILSEQAVQHTAGAAARNPLEPSSSDLGEPFGADHRGKAGPA